jgi:hypothetical protein
VAKTTRKRTMATTRGYRSGLEDKISDQLKEAGVVFEYETFKIKYTVPETLHTYTPDFILPNGIIIESKGRFVVADRKKHLYVQKQHPDLDIRFVFSNSKAKISKGSKTTYADWCNKNGFLFADKLIPEEWINEVFKRS